MRVKKFSVCFSRGITRSSFLAFALIVAATQPSLAQVASTTLPEDAGSVGGVGTADLPGTSTPVGGVGTADLPGTSTPVGGVGTQEIPEEDIEPINALASVTASDIFVGGGVEFKKSVDVNIITAAPFDDNYNFNTELPIVDPEPFGEFAQFDVDTTLLIKYNKFRGEYQFGASGIDTPVNVVIAGFENQQLHDEADFGDYHLQLYDYNKTSGDLHNHRTYILNGYMNVFLQIYHYEDNLITFTNNGTIYLSFYDPLYFEGSYYGPGHGDGKSNLSFVNNGSIYSKTDWAVYIAGFLRGFCQFSK